MSTQQFRFQKTQTRKHAQRTPPKQGDPCSAASPSSLCRLKGLSRPTWPFAWHVDPPCRADDHKKNAHRQSFLLAGACDALNQSYGAALRVCIFLLRANMSIITIPQIKEEANVVCVDNS